MEHLKAKIRTVPDFPKPGIMFRDITTLLKDPESFREVIAHFTQRYRGKKIDKVVGIESRGFIIGGALAHALGIGFVPARKPGKLPAPSVKQRYTLEYGTDALEIHKDAISRGEKVLIVDDLVATGGTVRAAVDLVRTLGGSVVECAFVVELPDLHGREKLKDVPVYSLLFFEGD